MKRICSICARGGSKGVKSKNLREIAGNPLIAHSIIQASRSRLFNLIVVSSDSPKILEIALAAGADLAIRRPEQLATDTAAKLPVIQHCVEEAEDQSQTRFDICIDLDATSPLRSIGDIEEVVRITEMPGITNVITGAPSQRSPYFNIVELDGDGAPHLSKNLAGSVARRQDAPPCYDMNASIYGWKRSALFTQPSLFEKNTRLHVMPEERSHDIDTELDFLIVEMLLDRKTRTHG